MAKRKLSPRKLLVASTGVMTVSYLVACSRTSSPASDQNAMETTTDVTPVGDAPGNTRPNGVTPSDVGPNPNTQPPFTSCVANLPAPPAFPTDSPVNPGPTVTAPPVIANLPAPPTPPPDPTGIVANLVAPMVPTAMPTMVEPDAGPPDIFDAGEPPGDAGVDGDAGTRDAGTGGSSGSGSGSGSGVTGAL